MQEDESVSRLEDSPGEQKQIAPVSGGHAKSRVWRWLAIVLIVLLLAGGGALGWLAWQCREDKSALEADKRDLQSRVASLEEQLAAKDEDAAEEEADACDPAVSAELKENIAAAVESKNYAALEGYMADAVNSVLAASEKGGNVTPAQAVTDLEYLNNGTAPWDFALDEATVASYADGDYAAYFEEGVYVGKSSDDLVVAFNFDDCGNIDQIFISADASLL
jgi:hypothetical protein